MHHRPEETNINVPQNLPFRSQLKKAAKTAHRCRTVFHKKTMILVYHRVAQGNVDPWALGVSPAHFAQQLQVLKTIADPISLESLVNAKSDRELPPRPVCVTFDDGYADNLLAAKPALETYRVPGTVFVTPGYLGVPENLWWDELAKLILDPASRLDELRLSLNGFDHAWVFPQVEGQDPQCNWRAWDPIPGPRQAAYLEIYEVLVKLSDAAREQAMEQLRRGAIYPDRRQHRAMTEEEVRELAEGEFVQIGAHTLTHPILAHLTPEQQQQGDRRQQDPAGSTDWQNHHNLRLSLRQEEPLQPAYGRNGQNEWLCLCLLQLRRTGDPVFQPLSTAAVPAYGLGWGSICRRC
jgi:peptidoglycan/xylan/chitin deacetylase (PgdA/CDA1 family)